jgi:glycine amidinotransferase
VGNTLWYHADHIRPWQSTVDQYLKDSASNIQINHNICINGANVVRVGRDIIIDRDVFDFEYHNTFPDYRVHLVDNGGHMDGCFAILKPGVILANHYFDDYHRTFPGWEIIMLDNPTYAAAPSTGYQQPYPVYNGKFYDTTVDTNRSFNDHIVKHALDWVGDYRETYFELNCLVINEQNVVMLAENEPLAEELARRNITVHWVPFRARSFWDGAMHCLTVDIRRQSIVEDFFPERELCRQ